MAPPAGQRTFVPVPKLMGIQSRMAAAREAEDHDSGPRIESHRPMTSRAAHEAYLKRTRAASAPKVSEVEQRRRRMEEERNKKEKEKEKSSVKARMAREKKAEKERAEREERRRLGLPLVDVAGSQATIAGFFRGGGLEAAGRKREVDLGRTTVEGDKENQDPRDGEPPAKRVRLSQEVVRRAPSKKKVFGRNLPLKVNGVVLGKMEASLKKPPPSPTKSGIPVAFGRVGSTEQSAAELPLSKREEKVDGSPDRKGARLVETTMAVPKKSEDDLKPEEKMKMDIPEIKEDMGQTAHKAERVESMKSDSKPSALAEPAPTAKTPQLPTPGPSERPSLERQMSESTNATNTPFPVPKPATSRPPLDEGSALSTSAVPSLHLDGLSQEGVPTPRAAVESRTSAARPLSNSHPPVMPLGPSAKVTTGPSSVPQQPQVRLVPRQSSAKTPARGHPPPFHPARQPLQPTTTNSPMVSSNQFAARPQGKGPSPPIPPTKPTTNRPSVISPYHSRPPVPQASLSATSTAPPPNAASFNYVPAQSRVQPKPAGHRPPFVRPAPPQNRPTIPAFKKPIPAPRPNGPQTPKFLPKQAVPAIPNNTVMQRDAVAEGPPLSTQRFLETHLDDFPSATQAERELEEEFSPAPPPPRPANRTPTVGQQPSKPPTFSKPPVPLFGQSSGPRPTAATIPKPPPRLAPMVNPIPLQAVKQMDDALPFLSTQDFAFSSQDMRELEETETPSKAPTGHCSRPRPSPLSAGTPTTARINQFSQARAAVGTTSMSGRSSTPAAPTLPGEKNTAADAPGRPAMQTLSLADGDLARNSPLQQTPRDITENWKIFQGDERERQQPANIGSSPRGPPPVPSQETDYGDFSMDDVDLTGF